MLCVLFEYLVNEEVEAELGRLEEQIGGVAFEECSPSLCPEHLVE